MLAANMTASLTIKRGAVDAGGKRATLSTIASNLACSPAFPDVGGQLQERLRLATPITLYRSFAAGEPDVELGDTLEITPAGGTLTTYRARGVAKFEETMSANLPAFTELILEKVMVP